MTLPWLWRGAAAALLLVASPAPARADFTDAQCRRAVTAMQARAALLPDGDLSRRFAEHELRSALLEMESGDPDECEEMVEKAAEIIETRPYVLRPGEVLDGYGPDRRR